MDIGGGLIPPTPIKLNGDVVDNWNNFKMEFRVYMQAADLNNVPERRKIAIFLNLIGKEAFQLDKNKIITYPERRQGEEITLKFVMTGFERHFKACQDSIVYNRMQFNLRNQLMGESFSSFLEAIARLAETCQFGNQDEAIRDKIIAGIYDQGLQSALIMMQDQTLDNVIKVCLEVETQQKNKKFPLANESSAFFHKKVFMNQNQNSNRYNDGVRKDMGNGSSSSRPSQHQNLNQNNKDVRKDNGSSSLRQNQHQNSNQNNDDVRKDMDNESSSSRQNSEPDIRNKPSSSNQNPESEKRKSVSRPFGSIRVSPRENKATGSKKSRNSLYEETYNLEPGESSIDDAEEQIQEMPFSRRASHGETRDESMPGPSGVSSEQNNFKQNNNTQKKHECTLCNKKYVKLKSLKTHLRWHSGKGLHKCAKCGNVYLHLYTLRRHERKVHNVADSD